jgi:hypothetical protein
VVTLGLELRTWLDPSTSPRRIPALLALATGRSERRHLSLLLDALSTRAPALLAADGLALLLAPLPAALCEGGARGGMRTPSLLVWSEVPSTT